MKRAALAVVMLCLPGAMCSTTRAGLPPQADIAALTAPKPKPGVDILTDPAASDRHNAAIEAWGDGLSSAGMRLCRFYAGLGMKVACR